MKRRKLIIDCDPGVDDATALLLAFAAPDALDILGVTVVAGNKGLARTARLVQRVIDVREVEDLRPVHDRSAELHRFDRILAAMRHE